MNSDSPTCLDLRLSVPEDWDVLPIESVTDFQEGPGILAKDFHDTGIPLLRLRNIETPSVQLAGCNFLDPEKVAKKWAHFGLQKGDLLISTSASLGRVSVVGADAVGAVAYTGIIRFRSSSPKLDHKYLRAFLSSAAFVNQAQQMATGSVIKHFGPSHLRQMAIALPSLSEQSQIAEIFDALDDRIALLRETNATFEAIAQALFKSWFVDFDPVHAKQQGRAPEGIDEAIAALFPDSFEESELGLVPNGWKVKTLGEICAVTIGGLWGKDTREDLDLIPAISLRGVDLENLRLLGYAKEAPVRWVKPAAMEKRQVSENEVLIASSGAGPCGRPLWGGGNFESLYGKPVIFSNFVKRLDCGSPSKAIYIDRLLAEMRASREIWNYINGTSIPNLDDKLLLATKKVVIPNEYVLEAFEQVARAIYLKLYSNQAQTLANLRDTLLPRLISGQLRLPEAEAELELEEATL